MNAALFAGLLFAVTTLPPDLSGTWATADSLTSGVVGQAELHLESDGHGLLAGSSAPAGGKAGGPRIFLGAPVLATLDGSKLMLQPLLPKGEKDKRTCDYVASPPSIICEGFTLRLRSKVISSENAQLIETVRRKEGSLTPAPLLGQDRAR